MNKKQIKILGILGCLALIGTASAAWNFSQGSEASKKLSLKIEKYTSIGTISVVDGGEAAYLNFDDGSVEWKEASDIVATYTPMGENSTEVSPTYTWTIELSTNLATYVDVSATSGTWASGVAITLPTITYKEGKNPTTASEYNAMYSALSASSEGVTLKVKANI